MAFSAAHSVMPSVDQKRHIEFLAKARSAGKRHWPDNAQPGQIATVPVFDLRIDRRPSGRRGHKAGLAGAPSVRPSGFDPWSHKYRAAVSRPDPGRFLKPPQRPLPARAPTRAASFCVQDVYPTELVRP